MNRLYTLTIIGVLLGMASVTLAASPAAAPVKPPAKAPVKPPVKPPTTAPHNYSDEVAKYAKALSAADPVDAQAAVIGLAMLPPDAFPTIVAEAKNPKLDAKSAERLNKLIAQQAPWQAPRTRLLKERAAQRDWNQGTALAAYDKVGHRSPKWDAAAREGIRVFTEIGKSNLDPRDLLEKAIAAGCDDPLILYFEARSLGYAIDVDPETIQQFYEQAHAAFLKSAYPADRKIFCCLRNYHQIQSIEYKKAKPGKPISVEGWKKMLDMLEEIDRLWPELVTENLPEDTLREVAYLTLDSNDLDKPRRKAVFDRISALMEKARPGSAVALTVKGHFYVRYAWDARGGGYANTVTDEGFRLMAERLAIAEAALTQAWEKDHNQVYASIEMLKVELGQGKGRDTMELWFRRAMEADPDNRAACDAKMYYLQPKWHGSPQDMLMFARECFETQNWRGDLPQLQVSVLNDLAAYTGNRDAFFALPQAWAAIRAVDEPLVRYDPDNVYVRSRYCYDACRCGQWAIAQEQFKILGDNVVVSEFGGVGPYEVFKQSLRQKGGGANVP